MVFSVKGKIIGPIESDPFKQLGLSQLLEKSLYYARQKNDLDSAIIYLETLEKRTSYMTIDPADINVTCRGLNLLGVLYIHTARNSSLGMVKLLKAKEIAEANHCDSILIEIMGNLASLNYKEGIIHNKTEYINEAIELYRSAVKLASQSGNSEMLGFSTVNLAMTAFEENRIREVLTIIEKTIETEDVPIWQKDICKAIKSWYMGKKESSLIQIDSAIENIDIIGDELKNYYILRIASLKPEMLLRMGKTNEAKVLIIELIEKARQQNALTVKYALLEKLKEINFEQYNLNASNEIELEMHRIKDNILESSNINSISTGLAIFNDEKSNAELSSTIIKLHNYRLIVFFIVVLSVVILFFLIILISKYRQLAKDRERIVKKDIEIMSPSKDKLAGIRKNNENEEIYSDLYQRIINIMNSDDDVYSEEFSIVKLSELLNEKQANVSHAIQNGSGNNFNSLLAEIRIKKACKMILSQQKESEYTIEAIAYSVGYRSRSHFSSIFKKITGLTPTQYLKEAQKMQS